MKLFTLVVIVTASLYFPMQAQQKTSPLKEAPNYTSLTHWAAHPLKEDLADALPGRPGVLTDKQATAKVDVFFVYPTIYQGRQNPENPWNADVNDVQLNERIENSTIKFQASVFNGSCKVYSPRYRQMHLKGFFPKYSTHKKSALAIAYEDVAAAFEHYLTHNNKGRPFVIAAHSQGTMHATRLLKDKILGTPLQKKLVTAYLVGMPVPRNEFSDQLPPCETAGQTGCWVSWNTFKKRHYPPEFQKRYAHTLSVNPLNWSLEDTYVPRETNKGAVLRNFEKILPATNDAQNHQGVLWVSKPRFFGNFLYWSKSYHIADYNLFYLNIRENVALRVRNFLSPNRNRL